jgi:hypothetical protein
MVYDFGLLRSIHLFCRPVELRYCNYSVPKLPAGLQRRFAGTSTRGVADKFIKWILGQYLKMEDLADPWR